MSRTHVPSRAMLSLLALVTSAVSASAQIPSPTGSPRDFGIQTHDDPTRELPAPPRSNPQEGNLFCGDESITQSTNPDTVTAPSVWCGTLESSALTSVARGFTIAEDVSLTCLTFGVSECSGGDWPVRVRLLQGNPGDSYDSLALLAESEYLIPDGTDRQLFTVQTPQITMVAGGNYIVELLTPSRLLDEGGDGGLIALGFNNLGQSAPSYLRAPGCGVDNFVTLQSIGFGNRHLVMSLGVAQPNASLPECEPLTIENGGFETGVLGAYTTVLDNFTSGIWGAEVGAIVTGSSDGVSPRTGSRMLRLTNDFLVVSQVVQAVPLGSLANLVDSGLLTANFDGWFNASDGVAAASVYTMIRFYSSNDLSSQIAAYSDGRVLDALPGTWQTEGIRAPIPVGARYMVVEVGFRNSSIGGAAGYMDDATLCIARNCTYESIGNSGFEGMTLGDYATVLNNFSTSVGLWGVESGSIATGPTDGVSPLRGSRMLRLTDDGLSVTQAVQVVDVRSQSSLIDLGGTKATFGAYFNASAGVSAAGSYAMIRFYGSGGFLDPIGITQTSKVLDALPGRWEWNATSKAVPVGTRWMVLEVGFSNATIGSLAGFVDDAIFCLGCDCERLGIEDAGFERLPLGSYVTVLNNFSTQQGIWGAESGTIESGLVDSVLPHRGSRMLRMTDDGLAATQAVQVLNVSSMANIIDAGLVDATFSAQMNASDGVSAATGSTTIRFYGPSGFSHPLTPISAGRAFDSDPATWEANAVRGTVPFGTRWIVTEVSFSNATIGGLAGFVDSTKLCLTRRAFNFGGFRYNSLNGATLASDGLLTFVEPPVPMSGDYGVGIEFGTAVSGISPPVVAWENLPGEHVSFTFSNESEEERFEFEHVAPDTTRLHTYFADGDNVSDLLIFNDGQLVVEVVDVATGEVVIHHQRAVPFPGAAPNPEVGVKLKLTCSWRRHYRLDSIAPIIKFEVSVGGNTYIGDTIILAKRPPYDLPPPGCIVFLETNAAAGLALSGNAAAAVGTGISRPFENEFQHLNTQGIFASHQNYENCPTCFTELFAGDFYGLGHASLRMVSDSGSDPAEVLFELGGVESASLFLTDPRSFPLPHTEFTHLIEYEYAAAGGGPAGRFTIDHCDGCPPPFDNGTGFSISADFAGVGSETYTLEVWNNDTLMYAASGMSGLAGYVADLPDVIGKLGGATPCGRKCWPDGSDIYIPGAGQTFAMTEIRLVCEGVVGPADLLENVRFRTVGMAELTFADITTVLADTSKPCLADLAEPFGVLDLADIVAFITAFSSADPLADLAEPFGVFDLADIVAFIDAFTTGCP